VVHQEALQNELAGRSGMDAEALKVFLREGTTAFYGSFFFWVNVCALFLQAFLASRLLKFGGIGLVLLMLPVIALVGYSAMAFLPFLLVVRVMFNVFLGVLWLSIALVVVRDYGDISELGDAASDPMRTDQATRPPPHSGSTEGNQE